jgi:hypothetical protein
MVPYTRLVCPMSFYRRGTVSVRPTLCVSIAYSLDTLAIDCRFAGGDGGQLGRLRHSLSGHQPPP